MVLAVSATALPLETAMIWRTEQSLAPQAYAQARWAAAPAQLVRQRLVDRLAPGGPMLSASIQGAAQLVVTLTAFEQVFEAGGGRSEGRVMLGVVLLHENRVVGSTQIQTAAPAPTQDAVGGVTALRQATAQAADRLAVWLDARAPSLRQKGACNVGTSHSPCL
jgi:cholesterol transport system auxiliary component